MPADLRSLQLCVEAAITSEESSATALLHTADQLAGQPFGDHLRDCARRHRVHAVKLRARLDALLNAYGKAD